LSLGAEKWIDFRESKNLIADVMAATDGLGPHAVIVSAAVVNLCFQMLGSLSPNPFFRPHLSTRRLGTFGPLGR